MDEEFDLETERILEEALKERDDEFGDEDDIGGDNESEKEGDKSGEGTKEKDDDGSSGNGDEGEHQEHNEEDSKLDFKPITVNVNGFDVTIDSEEAMMAYIKKGAETYNSKPKTASENELIIKQGELSDEDLKILVEAKRGSKEAIALIAKKAGIDILEVESEMADSYKESMQYNKPTELDDVANEILADDELHGKFMQISKVVPEDFLKEVASNAKDLKAFSNHIKTGVAEKVIPLAINLQIVNGGSFIENYNKAGVQLMQEKEKKKEQERTMTEREKDLRKKASSGTGHNDATRSSNGQDIWDLSEEDFNNLDLRNLK